MKRNRFAAMAAVLAVLSLLLTACGRQENTTTIAVACVVEQPMTDGMETLQMEQRQIPEITGVALYRRMIEEMKRSPANPQLKAVLPTVTVLREISVEDGVALCTFSENLAEVPPAQLTRILCALTRTLCQNEEIDAIRAVAGTEPLHEGKSRTPSPQRQQSWWKTNLKSPTSCPTNTDSSSSHISPKNVDNPVEKFFKKITERIEKNSIFAVQIITIKNKRIWN